MLNKIREIVDEVDFSGGDSTWFDLWHLHLYDNDKIRDTSENLEDYLKLLIESYKIVRVKLDKFPKQFQLWIEIDEEEFSQNAIYVHSENPNALNFPIKYPKDICIRPKNRKVESFMLSQGLAFIGIAGMDGNIFCFYDVNFGVPLSQTSR
ncbi:hypothetical protein [Flavihumibacter fluvii]|uniref:hypothetical protein n=1 Tax=Flavihumibacter fluvii TaxID=2838157 RepID=UPI001BDE3F13|nr:hypothetical protein [Flavihumibacter fluvii]ULQ51723.1 hypothetical protein KJS93_16675 [Flavihumibacter fluvii]